MEPITPDKAGLVALTKEQVARYWPVLSKGLVSALPPYSITKDFASSNMLKACMSGKMTCWLIKLDGKYSGAGTTQIIVDDVTGDRELLIYALYSAKVINDEQWMELARLLRDYAKRINCKTIVAHTAEPRLIALAEKFGGNADYRLITIGT